ncbi:hypothetical protein J6590_027643 [Homalodisca vitripennis]|nr:hypothetical protein J6590_027643 [Homalodisca vitripennis]
MVTGCPLFYKLSDSAQNSNSFIWSFISRFPTPPTVNSQCQLFGTLNKEGHLNLLSDSVPDLEGQQREEIWRRAQGTPLEQRLSLLTDIDINSCSSQMDTPPPSVPPTFRGRPYPYRLNNDVYFMSTGKTDERLNGGSITASYCSSRSALTPVGSFRSTHLFSPAKTPAANSTQIKYRDRSQSDALNWKSRTAELKNRRCSYLQDATHV